MFRKKKDSKNREKARLKVAKMEKHIADCRKWWIENESKRLTENYSVIGIENLNLKGISQFMINAKNINDTSFGTFTNRLINKGEENGTHVVKSDRFYPSSQICHVCGYHYNSDDFGGIKWNLNIREWNCPICKSHLNRDHNASINLKNNAINILMRREEFRSVEDVEDINSLVNQALMLEHSDETESIICEDIRKANTF